jgi:hypothetical protein
MEIYTNGQRTVTSPVRSLHVERINFGADQIDSIESRYPEACAPAGH